ncbi:putative bifunctional diguanylate cyclase/phosphodiesterase [Sphingomonas sp. TDK1]|uniref:putative bifunctional diguanylate cyclase/phosphodiesterase n=1 Tax=Sphingomonas sp. TDK1 TaxID=453247 RepID=UPI0007D9EA98|nr:EAL domain-containing protein [Sphingomonas sp. TDK1]OAN66754.1 response regulator PleD [Sphingomonas sp. TDK1]
MAKRVAGVAALGACVLLGAALGAGTARAVLWVALALSVPLTILAVLATLFLLQPRRNAALSAAVDRLHAAALGDLESPLPPKLMRNMPRLAQSIDELFLKLRGNLESVHRLAMFDTVTGLANRPHFRRSAERMLEDAPEEARAVLFFIDLDRFKAVNDTLGHAVGDVLLGMVANRLRAVGDQCAAFNHGETPLIGRLAGDEFTLFFADLPDPAARERVGEKVLQALSEPFDLAGQQVSIGASVGLALHPDHGLTLHDLMGAADAAMYQAKTQGRGRVETFSDGLAAQMIARARLETELRAAIEHDEFALVFQPQISAKSGVIVGAEALLRWQHPDGTKLPAAFLQRAEETGLIVEIGDWVVATVANTIARWGRLGIEQRLAVNVSQRQIDHASFFRHLRAAMLAAQAPARLLELEISETLAMHCSEDVLRAIAMLRSAGATVAVDDFGTGYSNLARLRRLPIDRVKLDRSVIEHVATNPEARAIAQAVIGLVHGLGCQAVAEGIETEAQATVLRVIGCDILQGYAIGAPMGEADFLAWVQGMTPQRATA